ncbi:hypothetical protein V5O48_015807 [Marasmius crinis-equi]|uniref:F-box domain-containing protein n=1 Tax=Marasmius crinis-equi TaxID=585013 RepID=A0ABR3ETI9_9AGAR
MPSVVLSQVCSRWRQITADYPQLWASINITFKDLRDHTKRILQLFLENSEGCDLNVRLFRQRWADYPLAQAEKDVWELLTRNLWRCRKLSFYAEYSPLFQFPSSGDQQISFPNLMIYEEDAPRPESHHERYNSGLIAWWKALRDAPKLTRVSTWVFHSPESLSYSQLTVLYVHLYPSEILELLHILPSSIQLEDLTLMHGWASTETHHLTFNPRPVEIPSLQKLVIGGFLIDHNSLREILELLRTPALKTLALHCWGGHAMENGWPSSILSLLERSPMLRDVLLYNDQCEPPTSDPSARPSLVLPLLYAIPNVEVLQLGIDSSEYALHFEEHADPLLSDLLGKLAQVELTPFLPKLVNLSLYMTDITLDTKCVEAILSTATARSPSVLANSGARGLIRPISHLSVLRFRDIATPFMPVDIDADLSARVQGLRNDGVVVDIGKGGHVPTQLVPRTVIEG